MICKKWNVRFLMRDVKTESDLARFVAKRFSNLEILMLIVDKLELLQRNGLRGGKPRQMDSPLIFKYFFFLNFFQWLGGVIKRSEQLFR